MQANLADCLTKWSKDTQLDAQGRWYKGPAFLYRPPEDWPEQNQIKQTSEERRAMVTHHMPAECPLIAIERFSKWSIAVRSMATVYRFVNNCRRKAKGLAIETLKATKRQAQLIKRPVKAVQIPLNNEEHRKAETFLFRMAQQDSFSNEIKSLCHDDKTKNAIDKKSPLYKLSPLIDEAGILRVDGRTANAEHMSYDARYPVILPNQHAITDLIAQLIKRPVKAVQIPLNNEEHRKAETFLCRMAQQDSFSNEIKSLCHDDKTKNGIDKKSPLYKLSPLIDEAGILRVDGRTANAEHMSYDARYPVILPNQHAITDLIVDSYHCKMFHANRETIVNEIRQKYSISHLRSLVDRRIEHCQHCKVYKSKQHYPRMGPLPVERLSPYTHPFSHVGVDFLGPLDIVNGRRKEKRYVAVFTCLVTMAVHLEVAYQLSTNSFIMAVRRFVSRRGSPAQIFSDNATNFVGASNELKREIAAINYNAADTFTNAHTTWSFIPPSAPHMGGVWERMVRSVKEALKALDDGRNLNDETLHTVLADAENLINSRPLCYMPHTSDTDEALTPNHFLVGSSSGTKTLLAPCPETAEALRSSYKRSRVLTSALWDRWIKQYFPILNLRSKWYDDKPPIRVGDLVFITEGNRKDWVRAIVEEVNESSDGRIRQAVVRTAKGKTFKRAVVKLAVLETEIR
uniref:Integrase catalytic domain-containing protein n=1 Tax=Anopheles minimus TaxID=112268 RepID=A0A182VSG3_9DIPT